MTQGTRSLIARASTFKLHLTQNTLIPTIGAPLGDFQINPPAQYTRYLPSHPCRNSFTPFPAPHSHAKSQPSQHSKV
uniref:Uncharacterized protein n=1 Tax=Arundo donax TaxID=35708 RepID=A0A0A9EZT5_ARUDO